MIIRSFIKFATSLPIISSPIIATEGGGCSPRSEEKKPLPVNTGSSSYPYAIAMWDFSWIERRWPGAGYEDWDRALDELKPTGLQRGPN